MAKSNYQFKKRQKEIARMTKREQKRQRKMKNNEISSEDSQDQASNSEECT
jgi:hypothetical protein